MADNIFDKLDEQSEILARIDKNTANESSTVEEMIRTNDPRMIEFVKTADRVFVYCGDKSELNRKNKKCRISCIKKNDSCLNTNCHRPFRNICSVHVLRIDIELACIFLPDL